MPQNAKKKREKKDIYEYKHSHAHSLLRHKRKSPFPQGDLPPFRFHRHLTHHTEVAKTSQPPVVHQIQ